MKPKLADSMNLQPFRHYRPRSSAPGQGSCVRLDTIESCIRSAVSHISRLGFERSSCLANTIAISATSSNDSNEIGGKPGLVQAQVRGNDDGKSARTFGVRVDLEHNTNSMISNAGAAQSVAAAGVEQSLHRGCARKLALFPLVFVSRTVTSGTGRAANTIGLKAKARDSLTAQPVKLDSQQTAIKP